MSSTNGRKPARRPRPSRPYRDSAFVYGAFAILVVVVAAVTGGRVLWAVVLASCAFVLATGWTWRSIRLREERKRQ
jgi:O-antigen ligase